METTVKRYIRSESASCAHMVEESAANCRKSVDPHEKLKALLNSPEEDTDDTLPPTDAPKFGTVIHNRIFVGGFSLTTTDEDLWKFFSGFATVTAARVIYDRAGVSKCYGFVTFASPRVARLIVKQSGGVMFSPLGRLRVAQAVRKQISQLPVLSTESAPLQAPLCYQLLCAPPLAPLPACAPCELPPPPYAVYPLPFDTCDQCELPFPKYAVYLPLLPFDKAEPLQAQLGYSQPCASPLASLPATYNLSSPSPYAGYTAYGQPFHTTPAIYGPPAQYALVPAPYSAPCCEPACCAPLDKQPRIPPPPLHPAYIY